MKSGLMVNVYALLAITRFKENVVSVALGKYITPNKKYAKSNAMRIRDGETAGANVCKVII